MLTLFSPLSKDLFLKVPENLQITQTVTSYTHYHQTKYTTQVQAGCWNLTPWGYSTTPGDRPDKAPEGVQLSESSTLLSCSTVAVSICCEFPTERVFIWPIMWCLFIMTSHGWGMCLSQLPEAKSRDKPHGKCNISTIWEGRHTLHHQILQRIPPPHSCLYA